VKRWEVRVWDERYDTETYVYGREPNSFLVDNAARLPRGRVLCLAEGEGRNAVFLAGLGYDVVAVDSSAVGLEKARRLAVDSNVAIDTVVADLADYPIPESSFAGVVSIFCHLPPPLRVDLHRRVVDGLEPGGSLLLEAFTPKQLDYRTGGPPDAAMMMTLDGLRHELEGLDFEHGRELVRPVHEGALHHGDSAVVQVIAHKR
jgi:SAM-dependent methyltransferase